MSRYGDNIRIIARTKELEEKIIKAAEQTELKLKAALAGQRGIAYYNPFSKNVGSTQSGTPGQTPPTGGSFGGNPINTPAAGEAERDGDDLLNGTDRPKIGEDVGSIELYDCETGERIDVRFNTGSNEGEAVFKHPSGWGADGTPPVVEGWYLGYYWSVSGSGVITASGQQAVALAQEYQESLGSNVGAFLGYFTFPGGVATTLPSPPGGTVSVRWQDDNFPGNPSFFIQEQITLTACGGTPPPDAADECALTEGPLQESWAAGTPHQLAYSVEAGGFVSSIYDPNIPEAFRNPTNNPIGAPSKLQLCTEDDVPVVVEALQDGGFAYFADDGDGEPDTTTHPIQHFDKNGKFLGVISQERYNFLEQ